MSCLDKGFKSFEIGFVELLHREVRKLDFVLRYPRIISLRNFSLEQPCKGLAPH
jgi:hypothetical protein